MNRKLPLFIALCLLVTPVHAAEAPKMVNVIVPVSCTAKNSTEKFSFSMNGDSQYTASPGILSLADGETGEFTVNIDYPGTYHYVIAQAPGSDQDVVYDGTFYEAEVFVSEDDMGKLAAETVVFAKGSSEKVSQCSFTNQCKTPPTTPSPSGASPVTGKDTLSPKGNIISTLSPKTGLLNHAKLYAGIGAALLVAALIILKRRGRR